MIKSQDEIDLSEARDLEEHHRALLLFWKRRRIELEKKLIDDPLAEMLEIAKEQWDEAKDD